MSSKNTCHLAVVAAVCLAAAGALAAADALSQLGVTADVARQQVMAGVARGLVNYSVAAPAFKAASGPVRAQLAQGAIAWARAHTESAGFKKEYAAARTARQPRPPDFQGTPEEEVQRMLDQQNKQLEKLKADIEAMPPEQRKQMEGAVSQAAAAIRQLDTPEMRNMQLAGIRHGRADSTERHTAALRKWETEYPEDPSLVIARRLKTFLEVSADVDYAAKLEPRDNRMYFADPAYERKSNEWKLCYRVGREAVDAARSAAAAWLKELESAKPGTPNERP